MFLPESFYVCVCILNLLKQTKKCGFLGDRKYTSFNGISLLNWVIHFLVIVLKALGV